MPESLKQKLGFGVAAIMMVAALGVLNVGAPAGAQAKRCKPDGGGGNQTESPSPSPTESEEPFPPELPPVVPEESESPSPTETTDEGGARKCPSEITLKYKGARRQFAGKVRSAEDECKSGRKVVLKKKKKGRDRRVETTVTNNRGGYKIPVRRANGRYYTRTSKQRVASEEGRVTCGGARSKAVRV